MNDLKRFPFPLTRVFAIVSLLVTGVATLIVVKLISIEEKTTLIEEGQGYAVRIAEHLNQSVGRHFFEPNLMRPLDFDLEEAGLFEKFDQVVRESTSAFGVDRILLFDEQGVVRYCTDPSFVGMRREEAEEIEEVRSGKIITHLKLRGADSDLDGTPHKKNLLETYYPLRLPPTAGESAGKMAGILEVYQDASPLFSEIRRAERRVALIVVVAMGGLFGILLLLVVKADRTIRQQHKEITGQRDRMEEMVRIRTQELFEAQNRLIEASRRASLGTIAAGVAHEINNPLGSMAACAEGLLQRAKTASFRESAEFRDFLDYLEIIRKEAYRCKEVTSRLLDLAKSSPIKKQWFRLGPLISDLKLLLAHQPRTTLRTLHFDVGDAAVHGDPNGIKQVLLNLLQNAFDAVHERPDAKIVLRSKVDHRNWTLTITDNGSGFDAAMKERLFDPFFTSKSPERGTGLGLAVSRAIVQRHGGEILAHSEGVGRGAQFTVTLPQNEPAHEP